MTYLRGWTNRLLQESPDHLGALWTRLLAMREGYLEPDRKDARENARRLVQHAGASIRQQLWDSLFVSIHEVFEDAAISVHQAQLATELKYYEPAEAAWLRVLEEEPDVEMQRNAYDALMKHYVPKRGRKAKGPLADPDKYAAAAIARARICDAFGQGLERYTELASDWDEEAVRTEWRVIPAHFRKGAGVGLLGAWLAAETPASEARQRVVMELLASELPVVRALGAPAVQHLTSRLDESLLLAQTDVASAFAEVLVDGKEEEGIRLGSRLAFVSARQATSSPSAWVRRCAAHCWSRGKARWRSSSPSWGRPRARRFWIPCGSMRIWRPGTRSRTGSPSAATRSSRGVPDRTGWCCSRQPRSSTGCLPKAWASSKAFWSCS